MAVRIFIIQSKGGVGKSYLTKLFALKATKEKRLTHFIDCDNISKSTFNFISGLPIEKRQFLKVKSENIIGNDNKIDRHKFNSLIETVSKLDSVICDFGVLACDQLISYIQQEISNGIIDVFKNLGINFYLVVAGGGSIIECVKYSENFNKIIGIKELTTLVANEYLGPVNGNSVKEHLLADIQIMPIHYDRDSVPQNQWDNFMNNGFIYDDILNLGIMRRRRFINYLDTIFEMIDQDNLKTD